MRNYTIQKSKEAISISKRKEEHLNIALNSPVEHMDVTTGFEQYRFVHQALPEMYLNDVNLSTTIFGKYLGAPIIISSMVGGIEPAAKINRNLARVAQSLNLAMGVGSERYLLDNPEALDTYRIRDVAPDILLFANLGAVQLNYGYSVKDCLKAVDIIGADVLMLHLNPLQEALQPEGNTNFCGILNKIKTICKELPVPVVVKEVGAGISTEAAARLAGAGVSGIDVAGAGGTCWSEIERMRSTDKRGERIARAFSSWGIPTADSILMTRSGAPDLPVIASGGIRNGIDLAKAIALGSDFAGIAMPLLKAAVESTAAVEDYLLEVIEELRIAMFCTGHAAIPDLKCSPRLVKY